MMVLNLKTAKRHCSSKRLQRLLAGLLLFLFVQDIGFHIAESFFTPPEGSARPILLGGRGFADPDGCGIPDHSETPFHHHHFPAVVTEAPLPVPLIAIARLIETLPPETTHVSSVPPTGRAPPLA
jgi:hypothetical protein